jgi:hypothetical protein
LAAVVHTVAITETNAAGRAPAGASPQRHPAHDLIGRTMTDYTATAICEGDHWVIDIPGIGTTQADSVDDLEEMAVDLVIAMTHTAPGTGPCRQDRRSRRTRLTCTYTGRAGGARTHDPGIMSAHALCAVPCCIHARR